LKEIIYGHIYFQHTNTFLTVNYNDENKVSQ